MSKQKVDKVATSIIVPVYGDWDSLKECIDSLKECIDSRECEVILVNDCGPDADTIEKNIKTRIKNVKGFHYYRNKENLGFVGNCNNAVAKYANKNSDILLLNSDTKVTADFLDELRSVLEEDEKVAVVSPRTNNATIATIPISAIYQKGIKPEASYELFVKVSEKLPQYFEAPTAHGFCMLIRRSVIEELGVLFDPIFGKGYGEEVDFCVRARAAGYTCALSNRAFVFHLEARSFSIEKKNELLALNNKIIIERYPHYKNEVESYIQQALLEEEKVYGGRYRLIRALRLIANRIKP